MAGWFLAPARIVVNAAAGTMCRPGRGIERSRRWGVQPPVRGLTTALLLGALMPWGLPPARAAAEPRVRVTGRVGDSGPFREGSLQARVGESVQLRVQVLDRRGRAQPLPPGARVLWRRVSPHMQHEHTPPPNEGISQYSNSVLFGPEHGRWLGYDSVEYETRALEHEGETLVLDAAREPGEPLGRFGGAGSIWLAARVLLPDGTALSTPDGADTDRLGLRAEVMRVSFRLGDDFLGWLGTYFHVPNVFGSTGPQADRYVGADCADVLVGARRASGGRRLGYTSVGGIARVARAVTPALAFDAHGRVVDETGAEVHLRWGDDLRPGDLLAIDYTRAGPLMPRAWDHIGALVGDHPEEGLPGVLDGADRLRHMTPRGLLDLPVGREGPIRFRVWRWRAPPRS